MFDMFHVGHLNILRHARSNCDYLIAGVVSDEKAVSVKGQGPVIPLSERLEIVSSCRFVDEAVAEQTTKLNMWRDLQFHRIFKGDDWRGTPKGQELEDSFRPVGVEVVYFPYTAHTSSTILRGVLERLVAS